MSNVCTFSSINKTYHRSIEPLVGAHTQIEDIWKTIDRLQKFRFDDQRTSFRRLTARSHSPSDESFFEQLAKCQVKSDAKDTLHLLSHLFLSNRTLVWTINELCFYPSVHQQFARCQLQQLLLLRAFLSMNQHQKHCRAQNFFHFLIVYKHSITKNKSSIHHGQNERT